MSEGANNYIPKAEDFTPALGIADVHGISRPSRSYWQDAWGRLKHNRRAVVSLCLIIGLLLFAIVGPLVWQVDPARQDIDQISQAPGAPRSALVIEPYRYWDGAVQPGFEGEGFHLAQPANSQVVRLVWDAVETASGLRLYRNIFPVDDERAYGLPIAEFGNGAAGFYEDRLNLRPDTYFYSLVSLDASGELSDQYQVLAVDVGRVITVDDVRQRELVPSTQALQVGDEVLLALHPLGTDYLGRDMLSRLMHGARVSLFIGIVAPLLYVLLGIAYGATAGFLGGRVDQLMMRFADFVVALPFLLFMILFQVMFGIGPGESGIMPLLLALIVLAWPATARLVRGQVLQIREEAYISASRLLGARSGYLVLRHMIPNTMGVILVTLTFAVPSAIFTEAFLSFIGMGVAPPTPSWGSMSNEGLATMLTHPHELIFPSVMISITVLAFNLLGDGLRDALDARMRGVS